MSSSLSFLCLTDKHLFASAFLDPNSSPERRQWGSCQGRARALSTTYWSRFLNTSSSVWLPTEHIPLGINNFIFFLWNYIWSDAWSLDFIYSAVLLGERSYFCVHCVFYFKSRPILEQEMHFLSGCSYLSEVV